MRIAFSRNTDEALFETLRQRVEGGELRIYDADDLLLATVRFTAARRIGTEISAELDRTALAIASGDAVRARCFAADKTPVLDCDVGDTASDAAIRLNTTEFRTGGPVLISNFSLGMNK